MCTEQFLAGEWGEIHFVTGLPCGPLDLLERLKRDSVTDHKDILARLRRLADFEPRCHDWFKRLKNAEDILQLRGGKYRFLLFPHPHKRRVLVLLHCFRKQSDRTERREIETALRLRNKYREMILRCEGRK